MAIEATSNLRQARTRCAAGYNDMINDRMLSRSHTHAERLAFELFVDVSLSGTKASAALIGTWDPACALQVARRFGDAATSSLTRTSFPSHVQRRRGPQGSSCQARIHLATKVRFTPMPAARFHLNIAIAAILSRSRPPSRARSCSVLVQNAKANAVRANLNTDDMLLSYVQVK